MGRQFIVVELGDHHATLFDGSTLEPVHRFPTRPNLHGGPKFSPDGRYVYFASRDDALHVIDKNTLEIVETLRPAPGKTAAHVEFTRDGSHALVSVWDDEGALVVYDAASLEEVKRIPMKKPSGKYNIYNKITRSSGTSH